MKYQKVRVGLSGFALFGLVFFSAAPIALAHQGSNSGSGSDELVATTTGTETETETEVDQAKVEDRIKHSKADGQEKLAALREKKQAKTAEQRQKVCEQRKGSINNRVTAYNKAANNKLKQFNTIFERVKKFKTDKALQVSNYDALITAATEKQTAASEAVAALKDLSADIDCTATDPASTVASIKSATIEARTALKEYRKSIKDIVVALAQVNKASDNSLSTPTTTEGDN
jgi:DNA anti-recombination protein RmuC